MAVDKQIMNRRQSVLINGIDPEILTEAQLKTDGFVTTADYASATVAGVTKVSSTYGVTVNTAGVLVGSAKTAEQYAGGGSTLIVCKGTLESIKVPIVTGGLSGISLDENLPAYDTAAVGTTWSGLQLVKTADGFELMWTTATTP